MLTLFCAPDKETDSTKPIMANPFLLTMIDWFSYPGIRQIIQPGNNFYFIVEGDVSSSLSAY